MATRVVSTKLAIEGESEYRNSVQRINAELKALQSSLKLTESNFASNANSMEALTAKQTALQKVYDAQKSKVKTLEEALKSAQAAVERYTAEHKRLTSEIEKNEKAMQELGDATGDTSEEHERLTRENRELGEALSKNDAYLKSAENGAATWQTQLNSATIKLNGLDAAIKENNKYLAEARTSAGNTATSIDEFGNRVNSSAQAVDALAKVLAASQIARGVKEIAEALWACGEASMSFESAMAGVAKTTDLTDAELEDMGESIKEMATRMPATVEEIAAVVEAAGQLGIAKQDLLAFSEVMINLGTSTNLSSEEAASSLAKFANIVNMSSDDYERLGSTIVDLGNNFATTEADIVSMAMRLASSGEIIGLTEPEIMAVATALSSVGIEAQAGGGSVSKLLKEFETMVAIGSPALVDFAAVAGMSAEQFSRAWNENAINTLSLFIDGLGRLDEKGENAVAVLNELDITEIRMSNAVLALATSQGILNETLGTANAAWKENTALATEASMRYETTESKFEMLKNAVGNVEIALGDQLNPALEKFSESGVEALEWAEEFIQENEWLAPVLGATAATLGVLTGAVVTYNAVQAAANLLINGFNLALEANPIGATALAIGTATAALIAFVNLAPDVHTLADEVADSRKRIDELSDATTDLTEELDGARDSARAMSGDVENLVSDLENLIAKDEKTAADLELVDLWVEELNESVPELGLKYDGLTNSLNLTSDAVLELARAYARQAEYAAATEALIEADRLHRDALTERTAAYENLLAAQQALDTYMTENDPTVKMSEEYISLTATVEEARAAYNAAADAVARTAEVMNETRAAVDSLADAEKAATAETETFSTSGAAALDVLRGKYEELELEYQSARDAAYESINEQIGLFDKMELEGKYSIDGLIASLRSQVEYMSVYAENLHAAADMGVNQGLIQILSDGSVESAEILAAIVAGGEEKVGELNDALGEVSEGKKTFAEEIAAIQTDFEDRLDAMATVLDEVVNNDLDMYDAAFESGANTALGLAAGVAAETDAVVAAYRKLAWAGVDAYRAITQQKSPSKLYERMGAFDVEGLIVGAKSKSEEAEKTYAALAETMIEAMSGTFETMRASDLTAAARIDDTLPPVLQTNDGSEIAAAVAGAMANAAPRTGDINITLEVPLDGQVIARKTFRLIRAEGERQGADLVEVK